MRRVHILFFSLSLLCLIGCGKPDEATQMVIDEITAITESNTLNIEDINTAYERYNTLTDKQKEQVTNYADLLKAQDQLNNVIKEVNATLEDEAKKAKQWKQFITPLMAEYQEVLVAYQDCKYYKDGYYTVLVYNDTYGRANKDWYFIFDSGSAWHCKYETGPIDSSYHFNSVTADVMENLVHKHLNGSDELPYMWDSNCYGSCSEPTMDGSKFVIKFD